MKNPKYEKFSDAILHFLRGNCIPATIGWDPHEPRFNASEIRIVLHATGSGYIHLLNQDSDTIEFKRIDE